MSTAPVRLAGKPATSIVNPVKRKANVLEMLSYVHSLGIDHIREADMVWIAEEAYNASLPPGWTEHEDENGRTYFYNTNRRESLWKHPLDQEFVEIANYWRRAIKAGGFWDIDEELAEMEEQIRASLADWMELYDDSGHKFFFNRKTEESLFDDPRHTTYHSLYTRIRFVNMMKEKLPLLALAPRATDPIVNAAELQRQQEEAENKAMRSVTRMQAAVRVMLARRKARLLSAKRCLNRVPPDLKGKLRLTVRTAVPGTHVKECVLQVTSSHRRNRAATRIQAHIRGLLARRRYRPMRDHRRFLIQNTIKIQRSLRHWLSTLADVKAARQARIQACIRLQCWARSMAARKLYSEKMGAYATFVKLKQVIISIQCHVRQWIARRRVKELRRLKYTSSVRLLQRQMKVFKAKAELMQHLRNEEPVQFIFHLTSGQKGSKILPFVWKLGMLPVGEDGLVIKPEEFRHQQLLEKMQRRKKRLGKKDEEEEVDAEPPRPIDLFSKVGVESLSDAAATVIQQTFHATQSGKKCRRAMGCARDLLDFVVDAAADQLATRAAAAPIIQSMFRGWLVRHNGIIDQKRKLHFSKKLEKIEIAQSFMHRFSSQLWLRKFIRESSVHEAASKIQAHVRGMHARKYVARLVEEAEWPVKGWFEYTGMGRDCVQINVKFLSNPSFDAWRYFRKYGKQQTLLERIQEMQAEIDSCLRAYLGPAEYAAMEARKAAGQAAQRAKAEAEREQQEVSAMSVADQESSAIEEVVRAEEAEVRRAEEERLLEEERLREEEEAREAEARAKEARRAEEALANFSDAAQAHLVEVSAMSISDQEPSAIEEVVRAEEAEVRQAEEERLLEEEGLREEGETQEAEARAQEAPRAEEALANFSDAAQAHLVEAEVRQAEEERLLEEEGLREEGEAQEAAPAEEARRAEEVVENSAQPQDLAHPGEQEVSQQSLQRKESLDDLLAPSTLDLPGGWEAVWSDEHEAYYFWHMPTDTVQWDPPDPASPVRPGASLEVPPQNELDKDPEGKGSAHGVLSAAAASLEHYARLSHGSGTHRSGGSHFSKGSRRHSAEDLRSTAPVPWGQERYQGQGFSQTQFRQAAPFYEPMERTGKPRFVIRPGLVDMDALNKIEGEKMDQRFRRDRISDKRREKYPIPSQVEYNRMNSTVQGVFHRHVHHHVHYYNDEEDQQRQPQPAEPAELPPKAEIEGEASQPQQDQPLQEFQTQKKSKKKQLSKSSVPSKSVHEILRPIGFFPGPVGAAGSGLRKARSKSEGKLVR